VTTGGNGKVVVETGWFRSQCAALSCAAGPGPDNDFLVANQFVQYPMATVSSDQTGIDVGLLPDWPGASAAAPAPVGGAVPSNAVDVAARLSWVTSTCTDGNDVICRAGDSYTVSAQILNEGTTPLTGVTAVLAIPDGDRFATSTPSRDLSLNRAGTAPGVTGMTVGSMSSSGVVALTFGGTLVPGGEIIVLGNLVVAGGTGTPGCVSGAPTTACPTVEPYGAPLMFAVSHIDQTGDPDSFGPNCDASVDVRACPTGIHDKQTEPDEVDPVGHNTAASVGGAQAYDLTADVVALDAAPVHAGDAVTWRVSAANTGPGNHVEGWTLSVLLPKNTSPTVPAANAMRSCTKTTSASGFPLIRCTGKGPLSPGVASSAMDISMPVPAGTAAGTSFPVIAYVTPAAGQAAEVIPFGSAPTQPSTDAAATATNNDASAMVTVAGGSNVAPTAAFTSNCSSLSCTFDGSGSTDSDGTVVNYAWNFGDGQTGSGINPSHTFAVGGIYSVSLTVTDDDAAVGATAAPVSVEATSTVVSFRGAATASGTATRVSVPVPTGVQPGDQLVLFVTSNVATTLTTPTGWTLLGTRSDGTPDIRSWVLTRTAVAGTGGSTVSATLGASSKVSRMLVAYSEADTVSVVASAVMGASTRALAAPPVGVAQDGSIVLSYWSDKSAGNSGWALPAQLTPRATSPGSGSGHITAATADALSPAGTWPGATANSSTAGSKGIAWSVVIPSN
jgi:PKD repeat protein